MRASQRRIKIPIIFLEAENVIDRIHRSSVISYRNIIKKMDAYKAQYPGKKMSDIEAAHLVAAELGIEIDFEDRRKVVQAISHGTPRGTRSRQPDQDLC